MSLPFDIVRAAVDQSDNLNVLEVFPTDDERFCYLMEQYCERSYSSNCLFDIVRYILHNRRFELLRQFDRMVELNRYDELYEVVLECRSVEVVKGWVDCGLQLPHYVANVAPKFGCVKVVEWLVRQKYDTDNEKMAISAAQSGEIDMVKWVLDGSSPTREMVYEAYHHLRYELLQWFHTEYNLCPPIGDIAGWAWYLSHRPIASSPNALVNAIEKAKEFYSLFGGFPDVYTARAVMVHGDEELIRWFIEELPKLTKMMMWREETLRSKIRELLLHSIGYTTDLHLIDYIIGEEKLNRDVIDDMFQSAMSRDNLIIVKYLIQRFGTPHNPRVGVMMANACYDVLRWLHDTSGLRLDDKYSIDAVSIQSSRDEAPEKRLLLIQWLLSMGVGNVMEMAETALWFEHYDIVGWICVNCNIPIHPALKELLDSGNVEPGLKFESLTDPFDIDELVSSGRLITLRWLSEHHPELIHRPKDVSLQIARHFNYHHTIDFITNHFQTEQ